VAWERVYTINNYYDGPRLGVADFGGKPHIFECRFDDVRDDWSDDFYLAEIDSELLALVLEDWEIWLRWRKSFDSGNATKDTHPALPQDRTRHETLKDKIGGRLKAPPDKSRIARARFRHVDLAGGEPEVEWLIPSG
jgi:hypothetical protein